MEYSKNKVVLIYPKSEEDSMKLIPLNLLSISIPLINEGFQVEIIDQRYEPLFFARLEDLIDKKVLCIGISCITGTQIKSVIEIMNFIKERKNIPIVLGGQHPTILPEQTLKTSLADYIIISDGELPFIKLIRAIKNDESAENIKGVCSKKDGNIIINQPDHRANYLNKIKYKKIPYNIINKYNNFNIIPIETSFGCTSNCAFCIEKILHPNLILLPVNNVVLMIKDALKAGAKVINFIDDNFFIEKRRIEELFKKCEEENISFKWICAGRIDKVSSFEDDFLILLKEKGLNSIYLGAESGSEKTLRLVNKKITIKMILDVNIKLKKVGVNPQFSFIGGFPTETKRDIKKTVDLMKKLKKENPNAIIWKINRYVPYPKTPLFELAKKEGFNPPNTFEGWNNIHFYHHELKHNYDIKL